MNPVRKSLQMQVEKWFGSEQSTLVRIVRTTGTRRYRCVAVSQPAFSYEIIFFRHDDKSWYVYPPEVGGRRVNQTFQIFQPAVLPALGIG